MGKLPGLSSYILDRETIKLDAYRLVCVFYASKEIARQSDPTGEYPDAAVRLEASFFAREMSRLLLSIAIAVRTLDDQMQRATGEAPLLVAYRKARESADRFAFMEFESMPLREACNKIIHANVVEAHTREGTEPHAYDEMYSEDTSESERLAWSHLSGHVRLGGTKGGKEWWCLLHVPTFVEALYALLHDGLAGVESVE